MDTPICDFVKKYIDADSLRLHMPGHKGKGALGFEEYDITEIDGADSLYEADGIIKQSEDNASAIFGCRTLYSTEGSSHCIRAMLWLLSLYARTAKKRPLVWAQRNVHKAFLYACALSDIETEWLYPNEQCSYIRCTVSAKELDHALTNACEKPVAYYLTSPDYLGNIADIADISRVCKKHGVLLLVDCAHGAYLKFLENSLHPIDLGADLCCASAHKTMPVLTGGAYLHISDSAPPLFAEKAKEALAVFGSTSPSYLILQSLDAANAYMANGCGKRLITFAQKVKGLKEELEAVGYSFVGDERIKLTIDAKAYGYSGDALARALANNGIACEFHDPDYTVMMLTPELEESGLDRLKKALLGIKRAKAITALPPRLCRGERVISVSEALTSPSETVPVSKSAGRILAAPSVSCPPAVPIAICGERINEDTALAFAYYGIEKVNVVK